MNTDAIMPEQGWIFVMGYTRYPGWGEKGEGGGGVRVDCGGKENDEEEIRTGEERRTRLAALKDEQLP